MDGPYPRDFLGQERLVTRMKIDFRLATTTGPKRCDPVLVPSGVNQFDALQEMVAAYACPDSVVLDVGAGHGDRDYPTRLKSIVGRIVGVDPSAAKTGGAPPLAPMRPSWPQDRALRDADGHRPHIPSGLPHGELSGCGGSSARSTRPS